MSGYLRPTIALVFGAIGILVGLSMATSVVTTAASNGAAANMGSFASAKSMNDLTPFIFYIMIIILSLGLIVVGGLGLAGKGPLKSS